MANIPNSNRYQTTGRNNGAPARSTSQRQRRGAPGRQQPTAQRVWGNNSTTTANPAGSVLLCLIGLCMLIAFPIPTIVIGAVLLIGTWLWGKS